MTIQQFLGAIFVTGFILAIAYFIYKAYEILQAFRGYPLE